MYSGTGRLGEQQDEVQDQDESDFDFISARFHSPDAGFPPKRIENYDEELVQHQTLNGTGMSRLVAPDKMGFLRKAQGVMFRTGVGRPRGDSARLMRPRFIRL